LLPALDGAEGGQAERHDDIDLVGDLFLGDASAAGSFDRHRAAHG